jgi:outer membrane protein assembly factor BamD (BamD/ComL family)
MNDRLFVRLSSGAVTLAAIALLFQVGCVSSRKSRVRSVETLPASNSDSLYVQLKMDFEAEDFEGAEAAARQFIFNYPQHPNIDEAHLIAARAGYQLAAYTQAVKYANVIPEEYPVSRYREEALFLSAEARAELGEYYQSAQTSWG